uniref:T9SS type A sorting domain-containing protein n=1 Tax=Microcystis aeruginosa TaxID=1126 RepID=UPI000933E3A1
TALTGLGGFLLRQDSNTGTPTILFDELRIADNIPNLLSTRSNEIAGLQIYPNPVNNGVVNIYTPSAAEKTIQVFDILGKQVMQTITSQEQINVSSLNSGIYILSISQEGNISRSKLIIK